MFPATELPEVLHRLAGLGQHEHRAVDGAGDEHPEHQPGEHAEVRGHLARALGGVAGVELHRCILRPEGRARSRCPLRPGRHSPAGAGNPAGAAGRSPARA